MTCLGVLENKEILNIVKELKEKNKNKKLYKFNIFTISKQGNELENFHSDIIAELLNPKGIHNENNLLLKTFIEFLNLNGAEIDGDNFNETIITREKGRIDIAIYNHLNEVIIIENKINGAIDANNQLKRYQEWCNEHGYNTIAIIYLTLSDEKSAPTFKDIQTKTINIAAFSNSNMDLVNGWIIPNIDKCTNFDTASFLKQYSKLLIYLAYDKMNNDLYDKFYKIADDMKVIKDIEELYVLASKLLKIRMDRLVKSINTFQPFTKSYRFKYNHVVYERFLEKGNSFKLDISFDKNGDANIRFWNTRNTEKSFISVQEKIKQIGYENKMQPKQEGQIGYHKKFKFSKYGSLKKLDKELISFLKDFMDKLNKS